MEILIDTHWNGYLKAVNKNLKWDEINISIDSYKFFYINRGINTRHTHFIRSNSAIVETIITLLTNVSNTLYNLYYNTLIINIPELSWKSNYILTKMIHHAQWNSKT